jgi:hypothetical protein
MDNGFAKGLWLTFLGWCSSLYAYFLPLYDWWLAVTILWVANFIIGFYTGKKQNGEVLNKKKAGIAVLELFAFLLITLIFLIIGRLICIDAHMIRGLYIATIAFAWYFAEGIFKNLARLLPRVWPLRYIHYLLNFELSKFLPNFNEFKDRKNETI